MLSENRYLSIVRASAAYDLLVTWPFATPWTFVWLYSQLAGVAPAGSGSAFRGVGVAAAAPHPQAKLFSSFNVLLGREWGRGCL